MWTIKTKDGYQARNVAAFEFWSHIRFDRYWGYRFFYASKGRFTMLICSLLGGLLFGLPPGALAGMIYVLLYGRASSQVWLSEMPKRVHNRCGFWPACRCALHLLVGDHLSQSFSKLGLIGELFQAKRV